MKVSILEIAKLAGVSRGTVDRVIHKRGKVKQEVEEKILRIIQETGYVPPSAREPDVVREQKPKKTWFKIGFLVPYEDHPFFQTMIQGARMAEQECGENSVMLIVEAANGYDGQNHIQALQHLAEQNVDGICAVSVDDSKVVSEFNEVIRKGTPIITVNSDVHNIKRICYVGCNALESGRIAAGVFGMMFKDSANIIIVTGSPLMRMHNQRVQGFFEGAIDRIKHVHIVDVVECADRDEIAYEKVCASLKRMPEVDGIYIAAEGISGVCMAVKDSGLEDQIRIVCHDSSPRTVQLLREGLIDATVCQEGFLQGMRAVQLMMEHLSSQASLPRDGYFTHCYLKIRENFEGSAI